MTMPAYILRRLSVGWRREFAVGLAVLMGLLLLLVASASPAHAAFGLVPGSFDVEAINRDGGGNPIAATQAGSHPDELITRFSLNTTVNSRGQTVLDEELRNVEMDLPVGFVGDPTVVPRCEAAELANNFVCAHSAQVGVAKLIDVLGNSVDLPVYNMVPPAGVPARFAFPTPGGVINLDASVRTGGDYGLTVKLRNVSQAASFAGTELTMWGVPADPSHDAQRGGCLSGALTPPCASEAPLKPFLTQQTDCSTGPVRTTIRVESWSGSTDSAFVDSHLPAPDDSTLFGPTGCDLLEFDPALTVTPTNPKPDAPSGYEIELAVPQNEDPDGLASAHLEDAQVVLPEGVSVSPSSARGLTGCSPSEIGLDSDAAPTCPNSSKIGTVEIDTPILDDVMTGSIYVANQNDNPFNSLLAIYVVAEGPGVIVKLAAKVDPDPKTGRLTTTFSDNPALPFNTLTLRFKGGPRAPLANPPTCGEKSVSASLTPYSAYPEPPSPRIADPTNVAHITSSFVIDCPGMSGFAPAFVAGSMTPTGGRFSPFSVGIERPDRQEYMSALTVELPPGLLAKVKDVPLCPEGDAAAGRCGIESRVGTATVGAGPGDDPLHLQGTVSLTGPYKGAPYGLAVSVPAKAGPYDLGTVVVRQAIFIDPVDASLAVVSDPLPTILEGIPLRLRSVRVNIDRPGFVLNPTSCREKAIRATMGSTEGARHAVVQRFQVGDCRALPLRPRLSLELTGRRQTTDGRHPGLKAVLRQGAEQANLKAVSVKLPLSLALDPDNARALCEFDDGERGACPASSIIGSARVITPMLNKPLEGPVFFVKGVRIDPRTGRRIRTLPTLYIPLRGEIALDLRARTSVRRGKLVTTFPSIPDAPVSRFEMRLRGGRNGILVVTNGRRICGRRQIADTEIDGHNGKRADRAVKIKTPCRRGRGTRR